MTQVAAWDLPHAAQARSKPRPPASSFTFGIFSMASLHQGFQALDATRISALSMIAFSNASTALL